MRPAPGRYLSFDAVAGEYDQTRSIPPDVVDTIAGLCASAARLETGGLLLDAGAGTGRFSAPLAKAHPGRIVGVDVSLPMMGHARAKASAQMLPLVQADLQRLPFRAHSFQGILAVHILHLMEQWRLVLDELRRVLVPRRGVLLLGTEQGGRSIVVDYYYARARAQGLLTPSLGAPGHAAILALLRRGGAHTEPLFAPGLAWQRQVTVAQTLQALSQRTYSQMWPIPDAAHALLMRDAADFAARQLGGPARMETLDMRFALSAVRWRG